MIRYTCHTLILPTVESELAANGYRTETHAQYAGGGGGARVLTRGLTTIILNAAPDQVLATIDIWGMGQAAAARLIEAFAVERSAHPARQASAVPSFEF